MDLWFVTNKIFCMENTFVVIFFHNVYNNVFEANRSIDSCIAFNHLSWVRFLIVVVIVKDLKSWNLCN